MVSSTERYAWAGVFLTLVALAIPWFLWGNSTVVAGLPLWVWWHVGWLALSAVAFALFADRAWGVWVGDPA
jgi:hypothetical protein